MKRRTFEAGLAACLASGLTGCVTDLPGFGQETRTGSRTYSVDAGTPLAVRNRNGSVTVEGYDGDAVEVDFEIRGPSSESVSAVSVTGSRTDGQFRVVTEYDTDRRRASVALTIRCPDDVPVERVATTNGSVEVVEAAGNPTLVSENGSLTARNVEGTVALTTSNGSITARNVGSVASAKTTGGSIEIDVPAIDEDVTIRTANGNIDAALATDLDAEISATTTNGSVELHGLDLSGVETSRTSVSGTLGDGTYDLSIRTENGSIDLRPLSD